jgi:hypothetical protein
VFAVQSDEDDQISRRFRPQPVLTSTSGERTSSPVTTRVASPDTQRSGQPVTANPIGAQDGLFTAAQAARGEQHFKQSCMTCHKVEEQTGASFRASWGRGTVGEFLTVISRTMPRSSPGSLTPDAYASIVAFYLRQSGYPTGAAELPADATALSSVRIER